VAEQGLILGKVEPDLACAIALEFVECPRISANLEGVTLYDERLQRIGAETDWLRAEDPLHQLTRECLVAKREMHRSTIRPGNTGGWAAATAAKNREKYVKQALEAKIKARVLLQERGVFDLARKAGMTVRE
jgi:hypothetical protein